MVPLIIGGALAAGSIASNMYNSYANRKAAEDAYDEIQKAANTAVTSNQADIDRYKAFIHNMYGQGALNYENALSQFSHQPVYQNEGFTYGGDISQFYDPAANQRVEAAMSAINDSAATGGNRFSSDYANRVGAKQQAMASEEWANAYQRLMQDRQQQLTEWQNNTQNQWNNYNANVDRSKYLIDQLNNDRNAYTQGIGEATMATMNNRLGGLQTQANVAAGIANASQNNNPGGAIASALGPIAQFAGSYFGGS